MGASKRNDYTGMLTEQVFWKAVSSRALSGAYLLFGEEKLTMHMAINRVIGLLDQGFKDLNYRVIKPMDPKELYSECNQLPFFDSLRVLRLREWNRSDAEAMTEDSIPLPQTDPEPKKSKRAIPKTTPLKLIDPATVLLIEMSEDDKTDPYYKWFLKNAKERMVHFDPFTPDRALGFLQREAADKQVNAAKSVLQKCVEICGTDGYTLKNEFSKVTDAVGPGGTVTEELVKELVTPSKEGEAFTILDLLIEGKKKQGLFLLEQNVRKDPRGAPFSYAGLFLSRLKLMLRARLLLDAGKKPFEVTNILGGGYYYQKAVASAQKRTAEELRRAVTAFSRVDTRTKLGIADPAESLVLAVHESF